jgi:hypothetical protein
VASSRCISLPWCLLASNPFAREVSGVLSSNVCMFCRVWPTFVLTRWRASSSLGSVSGVGDGVVCDAYLCHGVVWHPIPLHTLSSNSTYLLCKRIGYQTTPWQRNGLRRRRWNSQSSITFHHRRRRWPWSAIIIINTEKFNAHLNSKFHYYELGESSRQN